MTPAVEAGERADAQPAVFATTHWSVVLAAKQGGSTEASDAIESLCVTYWFPLYAHIRRVGYGPEDSRDLTQAFFADLLGRDFLRNVAREKGRFRSRSGIGAAIPMPRSWRSVGTATGWQRARGRARGSVSGTYTPEAW